MTKLRRAALSSCSGELFVQAPGLWGHRGAPEESRGIRTETTAPPELESGGVVGLYLEPPRHSDALLPGAFVATVLRAQEDRSSTARVLCEAEGSRGPDPPESGGGYSCAVPSGRLDLRIDLPPFGTSFRWGLQVPAGAEVPVTLRLPVGVALTGEVAEKEIVASVFPRGLDRRQGGAEFAGRFQALPHGGAVRFENVAAGAYVYRIQGDAGVSSEAMIVVPESATEVRLPDLVLPELSSLGVQIDPPVDGKGLPWELQLLPRATNRHTRRTVTSETDPTGWHSFPDILAGDYFLFVEDSDGSLWVTEQLHIEDDRTLGLSLPGVAVEGRATLGEGPFIGELRFGGTHGSRKVTMATDEEGRFAGYLPEEGRWEVEISSEAMGCAPCDGAQGSLGIPPVEVTAGPSGKARLSIAIPNTRLAGRVFLEETTAAGETVRRLQPGATVFATRVSGTQEERGRQAQIWTDDGEFELLGLEPGVLRVGAMLADPPCESEWLEIEVEESSEAGSSIELILRRKTHLVVQLVSETGPVGGATVFAVVPDGKSARGVSEADGSVSLEVPPGKTGTLFVDAAGHGLALEPFQVRGEGAAPSPVLVSLVASSGSLVLSELPYEVFDQGSLISERGGVVPLRLIANLAPGKLSFGEAITISGLAPGGYRFCTRRGDCWEGVVFAGAPTELRLSEGK